MSLRPNEPFWSFKNGMMYSYPSLNEDIACDVVVVGGGLAAALLAYQSLELGLNTVIITEKDVVIVNTVGLSGSLDFELDFKFYETIASHGLDFALELYKASYDLHNRLEELIHKEEINCDYKQRDVLYFAAYKKEVKNLYNEYENLFMNHFGLLWHSTNQLEQLYGIANTYGGMLSRHGITLDPYRFTHDLLHKNESKGCCIYDKTIIDKINYSKRTLTLTTQDRKVIKCKKIVFCDNNIERHNLKFNLN